MNAFSLSHRTLSVTGNGYGKNANIWNIFNNNNNNNNNNNIVLKPKVDASLQHYHSVMWILILAAKINVSWLLQDADKTSSLRFIYREDSSQIYLITGFTTNLHFNFEISENLWAYVTINSVALFLLLFHKEY